jgi:hypothetical protein
MRSPLARLPPPTLEGAPSPALWAWAGAFQDFCAHPPLPKAGPPCQPPRRRVGAQQYLKLGATS